MLHCNIYSPINSFDSLPVRDTPLARGVIIMTNTTKRTKRNKKAIRHNGVPKRHPYLAARVAQVMLTIAAKATSVTKCFRAVTARTSSHPDEPQAPQRGKPGDKFSASSVTAARQNRARYTRRNATVCFPSPVISRTAGSPPRRLAECDKARQAMSSTQTGSP